jgi:hypothetical protein
MFFVIRVIFVVVCASYAGSFAGSLRFVDSPANLQSGVE